MDNLEISVIAPAYNEVDNIQPLVQRIGDVFVPLNMPFEAIIVDDASTDGTREKLLALADQYPWLRVVTLAKNSGQTAAMDAGFRAARGKIWGTVDADMQNDPGEIILIFPPLLISPKPMMSMPFIPATAFCRKMPNLPPHVKWRA